MNYYERHIGDYLKNTAHLSLLEHGVFTRLLDVYYTRESPLPDKEVARLVGARARDEKDALRAVLTEFFELVDGHWHQARCDSELESYRAGEPEREVKKANEDNRLRRHRDERATLFKVITEAGEHMSWNTPMADLRAAVARISSVAGVAGPPLPATAPATPATATQAPVPRHQTPDPVLKNKGAHPDATTSRALAEADPEPDDRQPGPGSVYGAAALAMRSRGMSDVTPTDPRLRALVDGGIGLDELSNIAIEAVEKRKGAPWAYKVVAARRTEAQAIAVAPKPDVLPWHDTRDGISARGQELGMGAWQDFERTAISRGVTPRYDAYRKGVLEADKAAQETVR